MRGALLVFFAFLGLYIWTMPPALPPYRDAGEMTTSAATLGVSHPTGYPSYILLGRVAQALPVGNKAYRTTLLSVVAGAVALALFYFLLASRLGVLAGLGAAALLGLNGTFWGVCLVPEMYSLWVLGALAVLGLAWRLREGYGERWWLGFCFVYGLCLTNRMDLVLWAPGLLWLALAAREGRPREEGLWGMIVLVVVPVVVGVMDSKAMVALLIVGTALWLAPAGGRGNWALKSLVFALAGLSLNAYLPVRSAGGPWLDWNHPAQLSNLLETLLRTKYGGTLDLLSKNYVRGELFLPNLVLYGRHLWENFSALGLLAALAGAAHLARSDRRTFLGTLGAFWWSGPVFLFLANMPPNPHAAAIVDPHYLLSELIVVFWAAHGLGILAKRQAAAAYAVVLALVLLPFGQGIFGRMDRRNHLFTYDYAKNVLASVPRGGVLVAKKDVQLYTLWHYQTLHGWRPDVRVVAQGLAGSPWYQASWRRLDPSLRLGPLRDGVQWNSFIKDNGTVYATPDCEVATDAASIGQNGMGTVFGAPPEGALPAGGLPPDPWPVFYLRGDYRYAVQPDFFTKDLIGDYARALYFKGSQASKAGERAKAVGLLERAWSMHWLFPESSVLLAYLAFTDGRLDDAKRDYGLTSSIYDDMVAFTEEYHSLPSLKASVRKGAAEAKTHLGVLHEKTGDLKSAERAYQEAVSLHPLAQTYFNMAVLYWDKDPGRAETALIDALRLEPGNQEHLKYLRQLRARRRPR